MDPLTRVVGIVATLLLGLRLIQIWTKDVVEGWALLEPAAIIQSWHLPHRFCVVMVGGKC